MSEQKNPKELANDVLGCVYRFVRDYIYDKQYPQLDDTQIMRSWQSLATAPPMDEYCIITHLNAVRHGSNYYQYDFSEPVDDKGERETAALVEHSVQIDFFSVDNQANTGAARRRADLVEMIANSFEANAIFAMMNADVGCLYCDSVMSFADVDERRRIRQRHSITLHLSQTLKHSTPQRYIESVQVRSIPADKYIKRG